jgi:hypothetical protein
MNTEEALDYLSKIKKEEPKTTEAKDEKKETVNPESKTEVDVKNPQTPSEIPEEKKGVEQKAEAKTDDKVEDKKPEVVKTDDKADKVVEKSEDKKADDRKPTKEEQTAYAFAREKNKRKEQKAKYEKRIKELEDELNKYKDLKLEHFKDKEGNPDQSSYLDWKFRERDMKDEVRNLKAQEQAEESAYIEQENIRRVNLSFPDEAEKKEYMSLLESKGQSFLEALNEADPNGVVLGYLSTQEKYPIVMKRLMTDMDSLRKVFRSHDPDILKYNIAQFCDEVLTQVPKSTPSVEPSKTEAPKKEIPIIGKQMTSTQTTEPVVKDRNYWNSYLTKHPRG